MKKFILEKFLSLLLPIIVGIIIYKSDCFNNYLQYLVIGFVSVLYIEAMALIWKNQEMELKIPYKWLLIIVCLVLILIVLYVLFESNIANAWQWVVVVLLLVAASVLDVAKLKH